MSGWSSGARRRGDDERKLHVCPGDPFCLFNAHSAVRGQLSAQSWRPASATEWKQAEPYSYWGSADLGLTSNSWTSFPKAAAPELTPGLLEMERAEVLINSPRFLSRPATGKKHVNAGGPPPPPPRTGGLVGLWRFSGGLGPNYTSSAGEL